jgi:hypothetical protein
MGRASIYAGRPDARKWLERAMELEKGYAAPWRRNALKVATKVDESYRAQEDGHFLFLFHPEEAEVLRTYFAPFYQEAWSTLARRYGYPPTGQVRVETFHEWNDFSVRVIGFTGFPALGRASAASSPRSRRWRASCAGSSAGPRPRGTSSRTSSRSASASTASRAG